LQHYSVQMNKDLTYSGTLSARRTLGAQLTKFVLSGGAGTGAQFLVLIVLVDLLHLAPGRASLIGAVVGAIVVYLLNRRFTFASQRGHRETLPRFVAMAATGAVLNGLLVGALSEAGLHFVLAQMVATVVVLVFNFIVSKLWIFR
jgi:putative flippase GtrA